MVRQELLDSDKEDEIPLMIFMHGGAWGSSFGTMYRLISLLFLERDYRVVILNYQTFPDGIVEEQMEEQMQTVDYFKERYHGDESSVGASMRDKAAPVYPFVRCTHWHDGSFEESHFDGMICMSGVYNLETVRKLEMKNG